MYYAEVFEYNPQRIYNVGDMVIYKRAYYICQSTPTGKDYVTGEWDKNYWSLYTDMVFKSLSKYNLNKHLVYKKPHEYKYVSRYGKIRQIVDEETGILYHETVSNYEIAESDKDKYITVTEITQNRLDIIAQEQYGNSILWWVIAMANNIIDAFEDVPMGTVLRIPPISNVYKKGNVLGTR